MRLGDDNGAWVDLGIAGYQFPQAGPGRHKWDANWLVIAGSVRIAGGASWSFRDPALTTWEVADTVAWLRRVADGAVPVATAVQNRPEAAGDEDVSCFDRLTASGWLTFTEPNLSFGVSGSNGSQVQLFVGLGHESGEPPVDVLHPRWSQIAVVTTRQQVEVAAAALEEELALTPAR